MRQINQTISGSVEYWLDCPLTALPSIILKLMDKIIPYNPSGLTLKDMFYISKDFNGKKK